MKRTRKTSYPPINIGSSFMLMIFIVLCMVIFAMLSFSSAMRDYQYSLRNAERTAAYYEANNQAEMMLSRIAAVLASTGSAEEQIQKLQALGQLSVSPVEGEDGQSSKLSVTYTISIDDSKSLQVILSTEPKGDVPYTIETWKQISNANWTGSQTLPVLGSD